MFYEMIIIMIKRRIKRTKLWNGGGTNSNIKISIINTEWWNLPKERIAVIYLHTIKLLKYPFLHAN